YDGLAIAQSYAADHSADAAEQQEALAAANKAVELAPDEADAFATRGYMRLRRTWDWSGAQADFEKALTLDDRNSKIQWGYALLLRALGRLPEAVAAAKKATELDPLSGAAWYFFSVSLIRSRQFAAAHEAIRRLREIAPESENPQSLLGGLELLEGNATEALATFRPLTDASLRLSGIACAEYALGHAKESQQAFDQFIAIEGHARAP